MLRSDCLAPGAAIFIALLAQSAAADVSPREVWSEWRAYMEGTGYAVSATEEEADGNLTVANIELSGTGPEGEGDFVMTLGTIGFADDGAGGVRVLLPGAMPLRITVAPEDDDDETVKLNLTYSQSGQSLAVTGSAADLSYAYAADTAGLSLDRLQVGEETLGPDQVRVDLRAEGLRSTTRTEIATLRSYAQEASIAQVSYDLFFDNPDGDGTLDMSGTLDNIALTGSGKVPLAISGAGDISEMIAAGFQMAGELTIGGSTTETKTTDPSSGSVNVTGNTESSALAVRFGEAGISYQGNQTGIALQAMVEGLPFPIDVGMAEAAFNLALPVTSDEEPQDLALGLTLAGFTMSDMLWGIFDPAGQLPRDPATVRMDLSGEAKLMVDILDPEAADKMNGAEAEIGEMQSLQLNDLLVELAGAQLTGAGGVTFDNSDKTTFPGTPKPVGELDFKLTGGVALIDKLTAMGLLPQQQAMGARMMMGLFGKPGDDPDTLTSKIEFTPEGEVLANGQRIR